MISIPSSICSTVRAAAFPLVFRNLWKRTCLPVLCGVLALMLGGAWIGVHAQAVNFGTVNVGSTSATPISITFTFGTAETLGSTTVVTQGATGLDFADAGTGTCKAGIAYAAGNTCTVGVSFTPKFAGTRYGAAKLLDGSGNVIATGYVQGTGVGPQVEFLPGTESTIGSSFTSPGGMVVDGSGNVFISDTGNNRVQKETLLAGNYTQSTLPTSTLDSPGGLAIDGGGNLYIADAYNNRVLKETPLAGDYAETTIGNGMNKPNGIAVDGSGNLYVADAYHGRVLKETLSATSYTQTVILTCGSVGEQTCPSAVAVDASDNLFITAYNSTQVLELTPSADGYTQSVIGSSLFWPSQIAIDGTGNLYIADTLNSRVVKETLSAGSYIQSTVSSSSIDWPWALAVDGNGNVYIADTYHNRVLKEDLWDPPLLSFDSTPEGAISSDSPQTVTIENNGNAALIFPIPSAGENPSVPANFDWDSSSTCKQTTASSSAALELAGGAICTMAFDYEPTTPGAITGLAELTDNNLNVTGAEQGIRLTGLPTSQTITFPQPVSPVYDGVAPITLSATGGASGNPVIFRIVSGPGSLSGTNNSVLTITGWGTIVIAANQAGNTDYAAAPQVTETITVLFSKLANLTAPAPGSFLTGSSATFTWSPGRGPTEYMLFLGSTGVRSDNLYNSGPTTATSVNVTGLPINGETIYARIYSFIGGAWHCDDYTYKAASKATLASPPPSSTLTGSSITFTWSAGTGVTEYYLLLGSNGVGSDNLYNSGYTTHKSVNVTGLPVNGETVYARLYSYVGGAWHYLDYTYTAE
jgi:sugar lactone lactonase YvrE